MTKTVEERLESLEFRMTAQETHWLETENKYRTLALNLETNTALTQKVSSQVATIAEFLAISKGAVKFFAVTANLARFILVVGGALLFILFLAKGKPGSPSINIPDL